MSGRATFDHGIEEGKIGLKAVAAELIETDQRHAYSALRAALYALQLQAAVHLAAQVPIIVRGLFFEGWGFSEAPSPVDTLDGPGARVARELPPMFQWI